MWASKDERQLGVAKAAELQQYANEQNTKEFFDGLKFVHGPVSNMVSPVCFLNGIPLVEKSNTM